VSSWLFIQKLLRGYYLDILVCLRERIPRRGAVRWPFNSRIPFVSISIERSRIGALCWLAKWRGHNQPIVTVDHNWYLQVTVNLWLKLIFSRPLRHFIENEAFFIKLTSCLTRRLLRQSRRSSCSLVLRELLRVFFCGSVRAVHIDTIIMDLALRTPVLKLLRLVNRCMNRHHSLCLLALNQSRSVRYRLVIVWILCRCDCSLYCAWLLLWRRDKMTCWSVCILAFSQDWFEMVRSHVSRLGHIGNSFAIVSRLITNLWCGLLVFAILHRCRLKREKVNFTWAGRDVTYLFWDLRWSSC